MSGIVDKLGGIGNWIASKGMAVMDGVFPPEKRAELLARIKSWALKNPKISAFLLTNLSLTAGPIILFVLFSLTVFVFALIVAIVVALLAAVAFTLFAVGVALLVLFPTVLFTTMTACFLFLWGLGGYYLFKWANSGDGPTPKGSAIGDKLNSLTGGKLDFVMDNAREAEAEGYGKNKPIESAPNASANGSADGQSNGTPKKKQGGTPAKSSGGGNGIGDVKKNIESGANGATKHANTNGVSSGVSNGAGKVTNTASGAKNVTKAANVGAPTDKVTKTANVDGVQGKVANSTGTVKGTLGGASGLA